jgi:hypothetical protein
MVLSGKDNTVPSQPRVTRRRFLGASGAAAAGFALSGTAGRGAESAAGDVIRGETDHFWYRAQPAGVYVDSQRGNKAFGHAKGKIILSEDNGHTWPHRCAFPDAARITFSHVLKNGNVLFATSAKLFLSTDNLRSYEQVTVKSPDGSNYVPHTPKNPELPGWYFHTLPGEVSWEINGAEMMVWGNDLKEFGRRSPTRFHEKNGEGWFRVDLRTGWIQQADVVFLKPKT